MGTGQHRGWRWALWGLGLLAAVALNAASLRYGPLNQDEGWYLYGARLVAEGQRPYVDFASTQGPVMSWVYALANPIVERWGVAGGRAFTSLLGFIAALLAARLAWRVARQDASAEAAAGSQAALVAFFLIAVNVFQSYFTTIVKTYALASLWLVLAFLLLSGVRGRAARLAPLAAGVCMALASATRISAVVAAGITALALLFARDLPRRAAAARAGWFIAGGAASALAVFLPFFVAAPEATWFCLVQYHAGRVVEGVLALKAGFIAKLLHDYSAAAGLAIVLLCWRVFGPRREARADWFGWALWGSVIGVSAVHLLAAFPYNDYQAMIYPLFAVGLATALVQRCKAFWAAATVCLICVAGAVSAPMLHDWVLVRDRIWWRTALASSPLTVLQQTARDIRALPGVTAGAQILTQDPYLAVEANLKLPRGMELGQFCYFPAWSAARARACHVLNAAQFRDVLQESTAPVAAFSGYGFAMRAPEVQPLADAERAELWRIVESRYAEKFAVEPFGQADTRLRVLMLRTGAD